jgi:hypothetical protein
MLGVKLRLVTLLALRPEAVATALTVMLEATRNGAEYWIDEPVGGAPSIV